MGMQMRLVIRVRLGVVMVSIAGREDTYSLVQDSDGSIDSNSLVAVIRSLERPIAMVEQEAE